jgi:hypothetical protein
MKWDWFINLMKKKKTKIEELTKGYNHFKVPTANENNYSITSI